MRAKLHRLELTGLGFARCTLNAFPESKFILHRDMLLSQEFARDAYKENSACAGGW